MTMAQHFDTHLAATKLKQAGFEEDKVDALIDVLRESSQDDLVTEEFLKGQLVQLEQRMIIKLGGLIVAAGAVLGLISQYLPTGGG